MSEGTALVASGDSQAVEAPSDWDKAVSVAYFRALGASQSAAADAAGVSERTVRAWEASTWWPQAHQRAVERWRTDLSAASRKSLLEAAKTDGALAFKVLERLDLGFSPKEVREAVRARLEEQAAVLMRELDAETAERVLRRIWQVWR